MTPSVPASCGCEWASRGTVTQKRGGSDRYRANNSWFPSLMFRLRWWRFYFLRMLRLSIALPKLKTMSFLGLGHKRFCVFTNENGPFADDRLLPWPEAYEIPGRDVNGPQPSSARSSTVVKKEIRLEAFDMIRAKRKCYLQTGDVSTEKRSKTASWARPLTFIAELIIQNVRLHFHLINIQSYRLVQREISGWDVSRRSHVSTYPFINVSVLKLDETGTDGRNVRLLIAERYTACSFRIFQLRINVNSGVANPTVKSIHDQCQFHWMDLSCAE